MTTCSRTHHPVRGVAAGVVVLAMLLASLSLWTAVPLAWVYIGSKLSDTQFPNAGPYAVVLAGIIVSILLIAWLIGRLNRLYMRITGTRTVARLRPGWLKSLRDSEEPLTFTVVEAVIIGSVVLAGLAFTVWFFVFAGSSIPQV